jgi:hypothetical protein
VNGYRPRLARQQYLTPDVAVPVSGRRDPMGRDEVRMAACVGLQRVDNAHNNSVRRGQPEAADMRTRSNSNLSRRSQSDDGDVGRCLVERRWGWYAPAQHTGGIRSGGTATTIKPRPVNDAGTNSYQALSAS